MLGHLFLGVMVPRVQERLTTWALGLKSKNTKRIQTLTTPAEHEKWLNKFANADHAGRPDPNIPMPDTPLEKHAEGASPTSVQKTSCARDPMQPQNYRDMGETDMLTRFWEWSVRMLFSVCVCVRLSGARRQGSRRW